MSKRFWKMADEAAPFEQAESRKPMDIFGGSQGGSTQTQTIQKSDPWAGVQPYLQDIFSRAQGQSQQPGLAAQSPATLQAQQLTQNRATAGNPLNPAAQSGLLSTIQGKNLDPSSNPYLASSVNDALGLARTQINGQFKGDNYGNSAHQEWLGRGLGTAATNAYMQNYGQERQNQMAAIGQAPAMAATDYNDISQLGQVGAQQDARAQAQTDSPWAQLQKYVTAVSGQGGGTTSGSSTNPYFTNPLASAMGLGVGGLGAYSLANSSGLLGGAAAGGAAGATMGGLPAWMMFAG